ncbi:MAG: PEGA domain-containing protein [Deltaproteobacteria bacterium]|nr:PEGA domain-containing protein [Deltaproteobacteria bacterium]
MTRIHISLFLIAGLAIAGLASPVSAQRRHARRRPQPADEAATPTPAAPATTPTASAAPEPEIPGSPDGPLLLPVLISDQRDGGTELDGDDTVAGRGIRETPLLRRLRRAFLFRQLHESILALEEHESVPPARITSQEIARWTATSQDAVHQLAMGDYDGARASLVAAQGISERAVEELNRETDRARQVLDTCLFVVRAYVETHAFTRAQQQARECRRLVPFVEPTAMIHPPEVRRALTHADALIDQAGHGSMIIRSDPSGCTVRLNGVEVGQSPYRLDDLPEGDYRVQVECDARHRGRVHNVAVRPGSHVLRVDTRFDAALRSQPFPALVYTDASARDAHRLADAFRVARATGASQVVLAIVDGPRLRLERVTIPPTGNLPPTGVSAQLTLPSDTGEDALRASVETLLSGADDSALAGSDSSPSAPFGQALMELPTWRLTTGIAAGALAVGAFVLAIQQRLARGNRGDQLLVPDFTDPDYLLRVGRWEDHRAPLRASSIVGGLLGSGAAALLMPQRRLSLTISLPLLGVGGALAVAGLVKFATRPGCQGLSEDRAHCIDRDQDADLAWLLGSLGAPLLTAGLLGLIYPSASGYDVALNISPTRGGLRLGLTLRL